MKKRPPSTAKEYSQGPGLVAGPRAVRELICSEATVQELLIANRKRLADLIELAEGKGIVVRDVSSDELDQRMQGQRHQGVVAIAKAFEYLAFDKLLKTAPDDACIAVLDEVQDPHNLGAIVRSASVFGLHGIVLPKHRSVRVTPVAIRASAGAVHHMNICLVTNLRQSIDTLRDTGFMSVGLDERGPFLLSDLPKTQGKIALILGSEGKGLRRLTQQGCDMLVAIPSLGRIKSLNVSVAAALAFYECSRRDKLDG